MVLIPDRLSALVAKGELTPRYYNPGDLFDEVHLVSLTDEKLPSPEDVQILAGRAKLILHNIPLPKRLFFQTLGYRVRLVKKWAKKILPLAHDINPDLIRCHGLGLNLVCAVEIKVARGTPVVTSLHNHPFQFSEPGWKARLKTALLRPCIKKALRNTDIAIGVYESLREPLNRLGASRVEIAYNVVGAAGIPVKQHYDLTSQQPRLLYVGRTLRGKDPSSIIRALKDVPGARLTLVGEGPFLPSLKALTDELDLGARVKFIHALPNENLCESMKDHDLFVLHNDYWGLPKTLMEAALAGLPIIANKLPVDKVPEISPPFFLAVENSPQGYAEAIRKLLASPDERAMWGRRARQTALQLWNPVSAEKHYVDIYNELMGKRPLPSASYLPPRSRLG